MQSNKMGHVWDIEDVLGDEYRVTEGVMSGLPRMS